ncbi:hypothetical protein [Metabacillus sp. 84]|uniref:hypothetical protein n=1 Tax=Metabacillus sp. 84 TaxID=3404705 RepID=UPI003CED3A50
MQGVESLINAIAGNPIISAAVLWIGGVLLSRIFKNKEEKPSEGALPASGRKPESPPANDLPEKAERTMQDIYEKAKVQTRENRQSSFNRRRKEELTVVKLEEPEKGKRKTGAVHNPALNGIIWAEIIGKPRSINPHYTRKPKIRP